MVCGGSPPSSKFGCGVCGGRGGISGANVASEILSEVIGYYLRDEARDVASRSRDRHRWGSRGRCTRIWWSRGWRRRDGEVDFFTHHDVEFLVAAIFFYINQFDNVLLLPLQAPPLMVPLLLGGLEGPWAVEAAAKDMRSFLGAAASGPRWRAALVVRRFQR